MYACKASVDMFGFSKDDFVDQIEDIITVGEFYEKAAGGQIIFTYAERRTSVRGSCRPRVTGTRLRHQDVELGASELGASHRGIGVEEEPFAVPTAEL